MASPPDPRASGTDEPGAVSATIELPTGADAAAIARRFIAEHSDSLDADLIGDA